MSMRNNFSRTHSSARIDAGVGIGPGGVNARYKGGISAFWKISDCIVAGITILELVQAMARKSRKRTRLTTRNRKANSRRMRHARTARSGRMRLNSSATLISGKQKGSAR